MSNGSGRAAVGILGAGYISDFHIQALKRLADVEVRAVCDLNQGIAQQLANSRGVPKAYGSLEDMLRREQLSAVHVLTPPHVHEAVAAQIMQAGADVFIEKPMCHTEAACHSLRMAATKTGRKIGVSHNFLFYPAYEKLVKDVRSGVLGKIDQVEIIWNRALGQIRGGPFGIFMLQTPTAILFEVAPHSFAMAVNLVGELGDIECDAFDKVALPKGKEFYRKWDIRGRKDNTTVRMRFSFIDGYPEHYVRVRGSHGTAVVDFDRNIYQLFQASGDILDVDRLSNTWRPAMRDIAQGIGTFKNVLFSKMKLTRRAAPFQDSINGAVEAFYTSRKSQVDERLSAELGEATVRLAERVAKAANLPAPKTYVAPVLPQPKKPSVLVLGGTGFIGKALVHRLLTDGYGVRVLARSPASVPEELLALGADVMKGDYTNEADITAAFGGIEYVFHLARGLGKTWEELKKSDLEPTLRVAELCLTHKVKRLVYTSSIAIYNAGDPNKVITEETPFDPGMARFSSYSRSKVECERVLIEMQKARGLPVVITRPGVVLGRGTNPYHWGIAGWPSTTICTLWGKGANPLPIVLVEDVADALVKMMVKPGIDGQSYNLCSKPMISAVEYLDEMDKAAGAHTRRIPLAPQKMYVSSVLKWVMKKIGRDRNAPFPSYADCVGRSLASRFDCTKAERELDWSPVTDKATILREGVEIPTREWVA
jgi:nucleoside-diphosphate-sugar epimerase/predicted dehydrogenase